MARMRKTTPWRGAQVILINDDDDDKNGDNDDRVYRIRVAESEDIRAVRQCGGSYQ